MIALIKLVCFKIFLAKPIAAPPFLKCYWFAKSLNWAPMAINKGNTDKAQWEFSEECKMSSHLSEIKKGFKGLDIWAETLKMVGLCIPRV